MIEISELRDSAQKAFPAGELVPDRDKSWRTIADLGWLMIDLAASSGGLELGLKALATVAFEQGKILSPAPLIPAALALSAISLSAALADREEWIARICGGEYVPLHLLTSNIEAEKTGRYSGTVPGIFEGDMASHVLVAFPDSYVLVPIGSPGTELRERSLWDSTRRMFDLMLTGYRPDPRLTVASGTDAAKLHNSLSLQAQVCLAAECLGGASEALARTVDYLQTRIQFGRPLAMFQALKHRCADMKVDLAMTEALLWQRASKPSLALSEAGALGARSREVYLAITEEMIQLHGGIALTQEHSAHLFMKRAQLNSQICGTIDAWFEHEGWQAIQA